MLDIFPGYLSITVDVQLKKLDLSGNGSINYFVEGTRGKGGYLVRTISEMHGLKRCNCCVHHLDHAMLAGGACQVEFTVRMSEFAKRGCRLRAVSL